MNFSGFKPYFTHASRAVLLVLLAACSNPLSGKTQKLQNFHSPNVNCNDLNFSSSNVTAQDIRALTHCLNSNHELEPLDQLLSEMTDADLNPFADLLNQAVHHQPKLLYVLKETYLRAKKSGQLQELEKTLSQLLADPKLNQSISKILQKNADALAAYVFNSDVDTQMSGVYALTHAKAFQRFGNETIDSPALSTIVTTSVEYVNAPDAVSLTKLYRMLSENGVDKSWSEATRENEEERVQNLAHFFEWLFRDGHYDTLANGVHRILSKPMVCFNGSREIVNPLSPVLKALSARGAKEATEYFNHDIKNLFLVAQGYCTFPYEVSKLIRLAEEASQVPGFQESYTIVRPLFNDPIFLQFLGSRASAEFVKQVAFLSNQNFFGDLFTLVSILQRTPLTNNGVELAQLLDTVLKTSSAAEARAVLDFLKPVLSKAEGYGSKVAKIAYEITHGFPSVDFPINEKLQKRLKASTVELLKKPSIPKTFDLAAYLIVSKKLDGILDQSLTYFSNLFNRGKFQLKDVAFSEPEVSALPVSKWLIQKSVFRPFIAQPTCGDFAYDWNFTDYNDQNSAAYLKQIDAILLCVNPNQTFRLAKDLIIYSIEHDAYGFLLNTQKQAVNTAFSLDSSLAFLSLHDFLEVSASDSEVLRSYFELGSKTLNQTKQALLPKSELRKYLGAALEDPLTHRAMSEITDLAPLRSRSSLPTLDVAKLTHLNAMVSRQQILKDVKVEAAIQAMFEEYCPSLSDEQRDCDIDSDQLALYIKSPSLLYRQIAKEFLDSSQSWLHPTQSEGLTHQKFAPTQVSDFEYHLNPTLHLLRGSPQAPRAILNAVNRITQDKMSVGKFLSERALKLTLIPYIYQLPTYPVTGKREFHHRIRIRLVNDLDRLELIAINADFKAFGLVANMGMGFIREIGLAWGDVPEDQRPTSLSLHKDPSQVRTLKEVQEFIVAEMSKYDKRMLQRLGDCDPRGRGRIRRFVASRLCNSEVFDLSARVFNLRFLLPLLTDELPKKDGGAGGLEFLRDLFYALYDGNSDAQRNSFADGVSLSDDCMQDPLSFPAPLPHCQKDLLTVISRVTHLGLLHQAGMAVINAQDHPVELLGHTIEKVSARAELASLFIQTLSDDSGIAFFKDAVDFGFQAPPATGKNLSLITQALSTVSDLTWIKLALELVPKLPHAPIQNRELFNSLLSMNTEELKPWIDFWLSHPESETVRFLNAASSKLSPAVRAETIQLLSDLTPISKDLAETLQSAKKLPSLETVRLKNDMHLWFKTLSTESATQTRVDLNHWVNSSRFDQFCTVFADPQWVSQAYKFLESVNQNPDSRIFLQSCEDFLNAH